LACDINKKLDVNDFSFGHITLILSLHYLVKCISCSLAVLGSARVGSEMINWIATKTIDNYIVSEKVTRVTSHYFHYNMCSKCPPPARMQAVDVDATRQQQVQNCVTQSGSLAVDASTYDFKIKTK